MMKKILLMVLTLAIPAFSALPQGEPLLDSKSLIITHTELTKTANNLQFRINQVKHIGVKNNFQKKLSEIQSKLDQAESNLSNLQILGNLARSKKLLSEAQYKLNILSRLQDIYFTGLKQVERIQDRYRTVTESARTLQNKLANNLINDIAADLKEYFRMLDSDGNVDAARGLLRVIENRVESAYDLVIKEQKSEQVVMHSWGRLQESYRRLATTGRNRTAEDPAYEKAIQLRQRIEDALAAREYGKAAQFIHMAEKLLAGIESYHSPADDVTDGQYSPATTCRQLLQETGERLNAMHGPKAGKLRPLLREAAGLAADAEKLETAGLQDKAEKKYRQAVRLLLRIRDAAGQRHADGTGAERAGTMLQDVRRLLDMAADKVPAEGAGILQKAEDFYRRGAEAVERGNVKPALKHLSAARKLAERSLQVGDNGKRQQQNNRRLKRELDEIRADVSRATAAANRSGNAQALSLCALAGELTVKAEQAYTKGRMAVATERLVAASRCARRAEKLADAAAPAPPALQSSVEKDGVMLAKTLTQLDSKITDASPREARDLYTEAAQLSQKADQHLAAGDLEAARMVYNVAGMFTSRAAGMLNYEERARRQTGGTIETLRRRIAASEPSGPDAASLLELADEFVRKSSRSLAAGEFRMAEEQVRAALSLVNRAEALAQDQEGAADGSLDNRIKAVDRDIERAHQLLR